MVDHRVAFQAAFQEAARCTTATHTHHVTQHDDDTQLRQNTICVVTYRGGPPGGMPGGIPLHAHDTTHNTTPTRNHNRRSVRRRPALTTSTTAILATRAVAGTQRKQAPTVVVHPVAARRAGLPCHTTDHNAANGTPGDADQPLSGVRYRLNTSTIGR